MKINAHRLESVRQVECSHSDSRPNSEISLIVVHCISLPAGHFGGKFIEELFCKKLDTSDHNDFSDLSKVTVSSHLLVRRDGLVLQFVPFNQRAWHAGPSAFKGISVCNDFSVGVELEGTDKSKYSDIQYQVLADICAELISTYDIPKEHIVGHSDIAPGRKTDPGDMFEWDRFRKLVAKV
jgi:N-acetyl-anhydromuramoyl-L-alanine amidase